MAMPMGSYYDSLKVYYLLNGIGRKPYNFIIFLLTGGGIGFYF